MILPGIDFAIGILEPDDLLVLIASQPGDAAIEGETGLFGHRDRWPDADTCYHNIRIERGPIA